MSFNLLTVLGISIIFVATTLGSAMVFFFKNISEKLNAIILGIASGVMFSASIFGLIIPAIEQSAYLNKLSFIPASCGIILGALLLVVLDIIIPLVSKSKLKKSTKLFLAVTIHNIPEGLAVGLAFGNAILISTQSAYISALSLAIGIAIQNFPEGATVSLPIKKETNSNKKGFLYGIISGIIEPIFALLGLLLATSISSLMPWFLSFAAGAMIFVTVEELIPESKFQNTHFGSWGFVGGFILMLVLELIL